MRINRFIFLSTLIFALTFFVTAFLVNYSLDKVDKILPSKDAMLAKIDWLERNGNKYTTLFLGPSYIQNNVIVKSFDSRMRKYGFESFSFSMSATHLDIFQELIVLQRLRKMGRMRPKYVFIEPSLIAGADNLNKDTERLRRLHTLQNTWEGCVQSMRFDKTAKEKISQCSIRLELCFANITGIGRLSAIQSRIDQTIKGAGRNRWIETRGYVPKRSRNNTALSSRDSNLRQKEFNANLVKMAGANGKEAPIDGVQKEIYIVANIIREARLMGAEPIILLTPGVSKYYFPMKALLEYEGVGKVQVFDFLRPETYPDIYQIDNFVDNNHLSEHGALIFSRALADEFSEYLAN